jgi:hypothetical protein
MTELGSDFDRSGPGGDLTAAMRLLSTPAEQVLAWLQNQAERLQTPRGAVWYDRNYGLDMRTYVADDEDPAVASHEINQELLKDERTIRARTDIQAAGNTWRVTIAVTYLDGKEYSLTFSVAAASSVLLLSSAIAT